MLSSGQPLKWDTTFNFVKKSCEKKSLTDSYWRHIVAQLVFWSASHLNPSQVQSPNLPWRSFILKPSEFNPRDFLWERDQYRSYEYWGWLCWLMEMSQSVNINCSFDFSVKCLLFTSQASFDQSPVWSRVTLVLHLFCKNNPELKLSWSLTFLDLLQNRLLFEFYWKDNHQLSGWWGNQFLSQELFRSQ